MEERERWDADTVSQRSRKTMADAELLVFTRVMRASRGQLVAIAGLRPLHPRRHSGEGVWGGDHLIPLDLPSRSYPAEGTDSQLPPPRR